MTLVLYLPCDVESLPGNKATRNHTAEPIWFALYKENRL